MTQKFDVVVIGGGPAGYPAAIRAAQNGLAAACIDNWEDPDGRRPFGGTCLNAGCIPSKALLESTELYHRAHAEFDRHGIGLSDLKMDIPVMQQRKRAIVEQLTSGIEALLKANKVTALRGHGRLLEGNRVEVTGADGETQILEAGHVVLATGSTPIEIPGARFDGERIVDSAGALRFADVPQRLGVIGAGVIGLELGSVWRRLGAEVVLLEAMDEFLTAVDRQVAKEALRQFKSQGLDIRLGAKVTSAERQGDEVRVSFEQNGDTGEVVVDRLIVCVGRRPFTGGLFGDGVEAKIDQRGFIDVDEHCRTSLPKVWAVGDVVRGPMLAHKGTEEGVMVADLIAGRVGEVNYRTIPSVIYTAPEIAWVGRTEEELKGEDRAYKAGSFGFAPNGRAKAMQQTSGFVKLLADSDTDEILGVHIIGPLAGELIAEAVLAMEFEGSAEDIQRTVHAHPTLSEVFHEAALSADRRALHAINR
jgi:dihydrolipoamide dehydrogenase